MRKIVLSERLNTVARFIMQDAAVADIGTDHGYLPVYLAQNSIARKMIAADIKKGPLMSAQASAEEYGVSGRIEFALTDGLKGLEKKGVDTIIIAGMGGETIIGILERAPWTRDNGVSLVLQPQTKLIKLLEWLADNGFMIADASLALDDGRIYAVLLAHAGESDCPDTFYARLLEKRDPLLPAYLTGCIAKARRAASGLAQSQRGLDASAAKEREIEKLQRLREETDKWQR